MRPAPRETRHRVCRPCRSSPNRSIDRLDPEASWAFITAVNVPHHPIGFLDMTTEAVGVEQGTGRAIGCKLAPDGSERCRISRERKGARLVGFEAVGDKFR